MKIVYQLLSWTPIVLSSLLQVHNATQNSRHLPNQLRLNFQTFAAELTYVDNINVNILKTIKCHYHLPDVSQFLEERLTESISIC